MCRATHSFPPQLYREGKIAQDTGSWKVQSARQPLAANALPTLEWVRANAEFWHPCAGYAEQAPLRRKGSSGAMFQRGPLGVISMAHVDVDHIKKPISGYIAELRGESVSVRVSVNPFPLRPLLMLPMNTYVTCDPSHLRMSFLFPRPLFRRRRRRSRRCGSRGTTTSRA